MSVRTLSDLIFHVRDISTGRPALLTVRMPARREAVSATDFLRNVHSLALALEARGLVKGERVAIFSESRPEWHVADFACQLLGAPTVPLIPTSPARQVGYVIRNSGCRWIFYSDSAKRDLLAELMGAVTSPPQTVAFDADAVMPEGTSITRLIGEGAERRGEIPIERFRGRVAEEDLASLLYTSGTTGDPKGVMLSHRNLVSNFLACDELFEDLGGQEQRAEVGVGALPGEQPIAARESGPELGELGDQRPQVSGIGCVRHRGGPGIRRRDATGCGRGRRCRG